MSAVLRVRRMRAVFGTVALLMALGSVRTAHAGWPSDGLPLGWADRDELGPELLSDGEGGVVVSWSGHRRAFLQRFTGFGEVAVGWPDTGLSLSADSVAQFPAKLVRTGEDLMAIFSQSRNGVSETLVQRFSMDGRPRWPSNRRLFGASEASFGRICPDGSGGFFSTGIQPLSRPYYRLRLQHWSADGTPAAGWPDSGQIILPATTSPYLFLAEDGGGGVWLAWSFDGDSRLIVQRRTHSGASYPGWPDSGLVVAAGPAPALGGMIPSGDGGIWLVWRDQRHDLGDVYALKLTSSGEPAAGFPSDGVRVCGEINLQFPVSMCSDEAAGVFILWTDRRWDGWEVYVQRITASGELASGWTEGGTLLSGERRASGGMLIADGRGGALAVWSSFEDCHARRITGEGESSMRWGAEMVVAKNLGGVSGISDGSGGVFLGLAHSDSWFFSSHLYLQRITRSGTVGPAPPSSFELSRAWPNPSRAVVHVEFTLAHEDEIEIDVLDVTGRLVRRVQDRREFAPGTHVIGWDGEDDLRRAASPGLYFVVARTAAESRVQRAVLIR